MNRFDHQWQKLTALARQDADDRATAAPYGFATRLSARAATAPRAGRWSAFEGFALRGLVVAAGLCLLAVVFNYASPGSDHEDEMGLTDSVSDVLDVS